MTEKMQKLLSSKISKWLYHLQNSEIKKKCQLQKIRDLRKTFFYIFKHILLVSEGWLDLNFQQNFNARSNHVLLTDTFRERVGRNNLIKYFSACVKILMVSYCLSWIKS